MYCYRSCHCRCTCGRYLLFARRVSTRISACAVKGESMKKTKKTTSYNAISIYLLSNLVVLLLIGGISPIIYTLLSQRSTIFACLLIILVACSSLMIVVGKIRYLFRTTLSCDKAISKIYFVTVCSFPWENVRYAAMFFDWADRWACSGYIVLSCDAICEKDCRLATYKFSNQIVVRVTDKNAAEIFSLLNAKLGLSLSREHFSNIELGQPLMLELPGRE